MQPVERQPTCVSGLPKCARNATESRQSHGNNPLNVIFDVIA